MLEKLEEMVLDRYPNAVYVEDDNMDMSKMNKVCYVVNDEGDGVVCNFLVAYINDDCTIWTAMFQNTR
jgi:hypothetical protein